MHRRDEQVTEEDNMKAIKCFLWKASPLSKRSVCCKSNRFLFEFKIKLCMAL